MQCGTGEITPRGSGCGSTRLDWPVIAGIDVALKFAHRNIGPRAVFLDSDDTLADPVIQLRAAHAENSTGFGYFKSQHR